MRARRLSERIAVIVEPGDRVGDEVYRGSAFEVSRVLTEQELAGFGGSTTGDQMSLGAPRPVAIGGLIVTLLAIVVFGLNIRGNMRSAGQNEPYMAQWRASQRAMAAFLAQFPDHVAWQSYTWPDWGIPVSLVGFWEHGRIQRGQTLFVNRRAYWASQYPGFTEAQIEQALYRRTVAEIDVALVLSDPTDEPTGMEPYSRSLAARIATRIAADSTWRLVGHVPGEPFSKPLAVYVRRGSRADTAAASSRVPADSGAPAAALPHALDAVAAHARRPTE